ncbi:uncharacterized protein PV09_03078 [Verruconis gallopava]|uniref:Protein ROT1 n=1 Tax=Verruconis gallopava TaxID=253628 RepID=A0A0D1YYW4_9PEZI|nr:uncharacterized protein PV09_03078 [Verruconis gallopava]KIW05882.1 hypothetical protein PV09_03078 [Verruconis gallopava]
MRRAAALLVVCAGIGATQTLDASVLTGTWTTKSNSTITGSGFYDATQDRFIEPSHPGISYSFTNDGFYEEAYFRVVSNPTSPECTSAMLQFQHGTYQLLANGSLSLTPFAVDGRQLESAPCKSNKATYSRYNQSELFERFSQYTDPYHNIPRLDLYQFNGAPLPPMYLVYKPPQMVPTTTLHPTSTSSATATAASSKMRRSLEEGIRLSPKEKRVNSGWLDADKWWWCGVGMTGAGSLLYFFF